MAYILVENVRGFFTTRPPLVVFMICLASFAIALITFAYIIKARNIADPNISEDWNSFLEKFSKIDFCVSPNISEHVALVNSTSKMHFADMSPSELYDSFKHRKSESSGHVISRRELESIKTDTKKPGNKIKEDITTNTVTAPSTIDKENVVNVTVLLNMEIIPTKNFRSVPLSLTRLTSSLSGRTLKLSSPEREKELMLTVRFPANLSTSSCEEMTDSGMCRIHSLMACVTFTGPASMLPKTKKPERSDVCEKNHYQPSTEFTFRPMAGTLKTLSASKYWCPKGTKLSTEYSFEESLTVLLSLHDRSVINLHLMRTSYFLFVMVVTLFCYAMVKGRHVKVKSSHIPYIEKIPSQA